MTSDATAPANDAAMAGFGPIARTWFTDVFAAPTPVQIAAWQAIGSGNNALVIAPTGSGKTLAAFLQSLDRLASRATQPALIGASEGAAPTQEPAAHVKGVRVLYISPLKALAVDIERNLQAPLRGMTATAERLGLPEPRVSVAVRSGDTTAAQRRRIATHPPDILITTPESLFLMLSSKAAETLRNVETVIVDEVHALAGTKRGAHLMVSLERVAALSQRGGFQRIGLSATVRPPERVAGFLAGDRDIAVISPPAAKTWDLSVVVPVEDMTEPDAGRDAAEQDGTGRQPSMWPPIERRILDLITSHRSTICFVNSRRVAERLTAHLNELHAHDLGVSDEPQPLPAQVMEPSAATKGRDGTEVPIVASAHHGSVSKQRRAQIEDDLKSGRLPCVVATSSLELGIDMGAVDLVIQVQSPPSVSSGLQRVGRAGHQVGAISQGVLFPTARGDMLESAVVARRMADGQIEAVHTLRNPLDVLAQQLVSMCVNAPHSASELFTIVRHCDAFRQLPRSVFDGVLDMLTGHYPSEDFAELRPRLVWDRRTDMLSARPGARRLVTTSSGTIPDRGLFGVFLVGEQTASGKHEPGRRVGELDEEMVYESRVGDVFTLGTSSWRIEDITHSQVMVSPAPGHPGRLPFWRGDSPSRPRELGAAIGASVRELAAADPGDALARLAHGGLDEMASRNLLAYLTEQREATGQLPDDRTILVERFRDEIGDWRLCVHCALGAAVLQPWALIIEHAGRERYGVDVHVTAINDGIIIQLPDVDADAPDAGLLSFAADDVESLVSEQVFGSALFAARFRECAARALLLPRRNPGTRAPLWQQRIKSAQLLAVAAGYRDFPIVVETMRECLQDVFDLPGLTSLMSAIASRRVRLVDVETQQPSPFARNLLFGYVGEFVYDTDQPLAERTLAAMSLDSGMLAELLGTEAGRQMLDVGVATRVEAGLQSVVADRRATTPERLWEVIRTIGPLTDDECRDRSTPDAAAWLRTLSAEHRIARVQINGRPAWCADTDVGLLRDALGIPIPAAMPAPPPRERHLAVRDLVLRWVRRHAAVTTESIRQRYGMAVATAQSALDGLIDEGLVIRGALIAVPPTPGEDSTEYRLGALVGEPDADQYCHEQVLALIKRRTLAQLRNQVEAVDQQQFGRFLDAWQQLPPAGAQVPQRPASHSAPTPDDLLAVVDLIAGYPIPASMLESVVLPARLPGYRPSLLDEALATGEMVWTGTRAIGQRDGWICLWPADIGPVPPRESTELTPLATRLAQRLDAGGGWRVTDLTDESAGPSAVLDALWELAWQGRATTDTFAPVRDLCAGRGALKTPTTPRARRRPMRVRVARPLPVGGARWAAPPEPGDESTRLLDALELELARYGVLTRGSVMTEPQTPSFADAYRLLSRMEESGATRRGYFVTGLGGAQFATPGAVDRLRTAPAAPMRLLAACDPVNPYGAALEWPATNGHRPARKAGALVVLDDAKPVCYVERGARTLLTFTSTDRPRLAEALRAIGAAVDAGQIGRLTIDKIDGSPALQADIGDELNAAGFVMVPRGYTRRRRTPGSNRQE
ncbi:DEAD/DEAH box helicase [Propionibacterium freudenreichii]|uniref:DEAD/DEAH box helicase n=1 Tax=Propionibacterium freudenreichii TaxID=1744 RepID=UPI000BC300B8|nr:DEAD/DEAH box helicase [Propionibacterium freudenreichii]MDK9592189.1 DEAD/DEAH box helicase [Propionibacterium freudenreichii]WFF34275.1 DEAD/DEAH box helicase [Propionibacterium freudenreichii]WFF36505.1 DEAD/DEAH box helicase [Propionibacterium freudenreichii]SBN51424.1 Putative ATP-DEPENDENT HELICASE LHR [Propionibacterium freudenreichii]